MDMIDSSPVTAQTAPSGQAGLKKQRLLIIGFVVIVLLVIAGIVSAIIGLLQDSATTAKIRDIFLIFMAFESLIIGAALVILVIQVASLINLLQNEVKPILKSTSETVNTLRGTTAFLSENMVAPIIKLNSYLAGFKKLTDLVSFKKK
ncbi:MAG: hypothetical protein A2X25_01285 [Chloroflexi bacterium GWB2_49_20]|nr:MAG: hypothetical protein A2X25_01285 [Chloroflexi bacterium GWB2_49_20]OGN76859.1 MAG: hypothetical protein A2X26_09070 [Chloroflexi bacterium GWC2_49_37]OGN84379.1 MAG: hypothetical protein A2X27_03085 [Chloroflexi bacterium GWD2_49_16]HCC78235.1 hypothetical protein [Anaerolineae bacterium]HCM96731.1 hypothetical protein [Anaerolineae bacterium]